MISFAFFSEFVGSCKACNLVSLDYLGIKKNPVLNLCCIPFFSWLLNVHPSSMKDIRVPFVIFRILICLSESL